MNFMKWFKKEASQGFVRIKNKTLTYK
jgi:hypothetical protein